MTTLTPEAKLILFLARSEMTEEHIGGLTDLVGSQGVTIDSGRVAELVAQHRVAPLVGLQADRLQSRGVAPGIDPMVVGLLRAAYRDTVRRNQVMAQEMLDIASAADAAGIRMVVRKGGHLAYAVYPDPGMRPMSDLDILVGRAQAQYLVEVLLKLGYQEGTPTSTGIEPFSRRQQIFWHLHGSDLPALSKRLDSFDRSSVSVDINVALALPKAGYSIPVASLIERAVMLQHNGRQFLALNAEDTVIDLCAHIYKSSTTLRFMHIGAKHRRLIKYLDVAEVIRSSGAAFSWPAFAARVAEYGVGIPTYYALAHFDLLYPGQVPNAYLAALRALCPEPDALLDQYGQWDLPEPIKWNQDFLTRFFGRGADKELPLSTSLV
jgi:Uncharacterised nucleotidyltransferase